MKKYEKKTYTHNKLVETQCDICGEKTDGDTWQKDYDQPRSWCKIEMSSSPPYDSELEVVHSIDICPECFENKLIPWVKSQKENP